MNTKIKNSNFKRRVLQLSIFSATLALSVFFQNCSVVSTSGRNDGSSTVSQSSVLTSKALSILAGKCAFCHNSTTAQGGVGDIMNVNYLLFNHLVIPGQPDISDLIRVIREGSMPPSGESVTAAELDALTKWIQSGLNDVDSATGEPIPVPGGSGGATATYASLNSTIFAPKCVGCHNNNLASGGVNISNFAGAQTAAKNGKLYSSVTRSGSNYMPQGGSRLTSDELNRLNQWISAGAPNN